MGSPFQLADQTIFVDSGMTFPLYQALQEATDVSAFDELDVLLQIVAVKGSGSISIEISTGMQWQTNDGWVTAGTFTASTTVGSQKLHVTGLLQYVRWKVTAMTFDNVSFALSGVLRSRAA